MAFSSIVRALARSPLTTELLSKLNRQKDLRLNGIPRLPKGLVASALAQNSGRNLFVVCATLEEAGRAYAQLEAMGWQTVHFYPTSEASPYEPFDPETEMTWGQMQVLADLVKSQESVNGQNKTIAVVATTNALQPHLPPPEAFSPLSLTLEKGMEFDLNAFSTKITTLGYERVPLVETEGQWSRRGDIVDIFPVSSELPVRLEWFGDEIEQIREFDPTTQRSALDKIGQIVLTPTSFTPIILDALKDSAEFRVLSAELKNESELETEESGVLEGSRRFLGLAFTKPASVLDYLPENTLIAIDEPEQCHAHSDRWVENAEEQWSLGTGELNLGSLQLPKIHRSFDDCLAELTQFQTVYLSEIAEENNGVNLASRSVPVTPHQFGKLAETLRQERDRNFSIWLISAQPSRSVSLLQEHDCPAQFIPNPRDYQAIEKLQINHTPVALKYSGLAELEGFILPTYRLVIITDREFYGQHSLATPGYIRKRRKAASKQVDPNKLRPGDYVVHRSHGIGKFVKLESLTINDETRDYIVVQYADGLLRVAADQVGSLSRFRATGDKAPELHKMTGKAWENTKNRVRKAIKKLAVDLLKLYAARSQQQGYSYPLTANLREMVPGARFAIAHGQMDESELESTMLTFSNGDADILVCTTIIESGLDIPRVNTILIEDAHRFGLSQLYQLRGRVGRAGIQAHAWLFYPKQRTLSDAARQRLRAIQEFTQLGSGYQLAMRDMEIRGVGNLLGAEQSGQMDAIGFDLYMEMLEEAIREIRGQEIPQVDDTQIDLNLTAFVPADYIPDIDQKMSAYRAVAAAKSKEELAQIAAEWSDRYGTLPVPANQLLRVMELKQLAKKLGFSRIKPENKQHVILETPMEEPAWNLLAANLPEHLKTRFVYSPGKVTVRGLAVMKADQQLQSLIDAMGRMQGAIAEAVVV
ncbi:TRCF domain-containing protein [Nostoc cycadae]|uniref:Transcription-repair coupling factor n=1 Tax=Nostoc cycadae WK-1 TaxID=1861711 RepID=A0A2H6LFB5_9NOSO|nr:TRCF domain-containing protein [Nostoc cycadae]GBE91911.1 transcription-repair coupling factor [Nostoc cycadae WK-1]